MESYLEMSVGSVWKTVFQYEVRALNGFFHTIHSIIMICIRNMRAIRVGAISAVYTGVESL